MTGKTILITGGTDGIGKATALQLAKPDDTVLIIGRNAEKGRRAQQAIAEKTGATVIFKAVDMSLMSEVQSFANEVLTTYPKLDYLVHCAGVIMPTPIITKEGLELVFATQYLSRYCLTQLLLPALNKSGKVLFVSGGNVTDGSVNYDALNNEETFGMYTTVLNTSKAQSLYTLILMSEHPKLGVYNYGPGIVNTSLTRNMSGIRGLLAKIAGHFIAVSPEQAGLEVAKLLTGAYQSGWYKKDLKNQPANNEAFIAEQSELKQFSDSLLHFR
ncbi:MAG: SDR family NAD(P)-dependent oxidoreductase [Chloroflexota bacterium]